YDFVVQVWSLDGVRVYLSRPHAVLPEITTLGFSTVSTAEGRWRVYGAEGRRRVIQAAQPMSERGQRAAQLALRTLAPFALLLPALALLIWLAVGHSLRPLERLTGLLTARRARTGTGGDRAGAVVRYAASRRGAAAGRRNAEAVHAPGPCTWAAALG